MRFAGGTKLRLDGCDLHISGYGARLDIFAEGATFFLDLNAELLKKIAVGPAQLTEEDEEESRFGYSL
jgi:hypothetical protein